MRPSGQAYGICLDLEVVAADGEGGIFPEAMLEGLDAAWSKTAAGKLIELS